MRSTVIENCKIDLINKFKESLVSLGWKSELVSLFIKKNNRPLSCEIEKELKNFSAIKAFQPVRTAETIDRLDDLASHDKRQRIASICWFGEQGEKEHISILKELRNDENEDKTKIAIETAISRIDERNSSKIGNLSLDENVEILMNFFNLKTDELHQSVSNTIDNCKNVRHPALRSVFNADNSSDVIIALQEIKYLLEKYHGSNEINKWLKTPVHKFKR